MSKFVLPYKPGTPGIDGVCAVCPILDANGKVVHTIRMMHCAQEGLGGYNMADMDEAKRDVARQAKAFCHGANSAR